MPHGALERIVRELTGSHLHYCRNCGRRGWHRGALTLAPPDQIEQGFPARAIEARDEDAHRRKRRQALLSLLTAVAMGTGAAFYLHGCQERAAAGAHGSAD